MSGFIGITCGFKEDKNSHVVTDYYVRAISAAGGIPVVLPATDRDCADKIYEKLDGFLFTGGPDLDPVYYGEEPQYGLGEITPIRDKFELRLAECVLKGEKPVLAICRGLQVINVAAGGTLYQDIKGITPQLHFQEAPRWYPTHEVKLQRETKMFSIIKKESFRVNSFHHQSVKDFGRGLTAVCFSSDGIVEGMEGSDPALWIMGVQWHPECCWEKDEISFSLFKELVHKAKGEYYGICG